MQYKITYQQNNKILTEVISLEQSSLDQKLQSFPNIIQIKQIKKKEKTLFLLNKKQEIYLFFKQLHLMLQSHLTFSEALQMIAQTNKNEYTQNIIDSIQKAITQNFPIEKALQKFQKNIGKMTISFLQQGIENGTIKSSISSIVLLLEKELTIKKNLSEKLRYPLFLIFSLCISLGMIFFYVVPGFEFIFNTLGDDLPFATKILLEFNYAIQNYWYIGLFLVIGVIFILVFLAYKYKSFFDRFIIIHIPLISKIVLEYQLYKLFLALYVMVHSKYRFQTAIENTIQTVTNLYLKQIMEQINQNIKNGEEIADAFNRYTLFDPLILKLLYTAQATSRYEEILLDITNYYEKSFEDRLGKLSSLIEPIIIFFIALIVLWIILAIMVPVWQMGAVGL